MTQRTFLNAKQARRVMLESRPFATPVTWRSAWQVGHTFGLMLLTLWVSYMLGPYLCVLLVPWMTGLFIRIFVLQHDCGHRSLFQKQRSNDRVGYAISIITSVPYHAWRTEHNWHHNHQGNLEKRGVDNMNSPMTLDEMPERMAEVNYRVKKIKPINIFLIGVHSLMIERKAPAGFFPFREAFKDSVRNRAQMLRGIMSIIPLHLIWQAVLIWAFGWWSSLLVVVPAMMIGSGIGALLFWVQHNFEETYYARVPAWNKANVAIYGSSYLKLNRLFRWFTADIGIHHVHHLNQGIPNYRLEEARQAIPEIQEVKPLDKLALQRSFSHMFWDEAHHRMRPLDADV